MVELTQFLESLTLKDYELLHELENDLREKAIWSHDTNDDKQATYYIDQLESLEKVTTLLQEYFKDELTEQWQREHINDFTEDKTDVEYSTD